MFPRTFHTVSGIMFAAIAALHGLRLIFGWEAVISGINIPAWLSILAVFVFGALAIFEFRGEQKCNNLPPKP
ncbi:MAG: hypothetical protein AAB524_00680 [Patescibacteria group bacterium]